MVTNRDEREKQIIKFDVLRTFNETVDLADQSKRGPDEGDEVIIVDHVAVPKVFVMVVTLFYLEWDLKLLV